VLPPSFQISLPCSVDSFTAGRIDRRPGRTPLGWGVHITVVSAVSQLLCVSCDLGLSIYRDVQGLGEGSGSVVVVARIFDGAKWEHHSPVNVRAKT
jgi:hypothetical protein